jgi:alpha-galactosidase
LKQYGWQYVVVDIRWYISNPQPYYNTTNPIYNIDAYGRYTPAINRFPSAANGMGFKALADSIHAMGLKFGIHMMRGLPIQAAKKKLPVLGGGGITCDQICNNDSACTWLYDNYKVKYTPQGQLYYNSLFDLYASWGVDFVKIDDLSRPVHTGEIDMIHRAIMQCGRPMVFSLSPGKTDLNWGKFVADRGNQWRMMDDLWDNWNQVYAVFKEADLWTPFYRPGNYPDADMLPLGALSYSLDRKSSRRGKLEPNEQRTMMNLWGIIHSPLFYGGNLPVNTAADDSLLTNADLIEMSHYGVRAHQVQNSDGCIIWSSLNPANGDHYAALFNVQGNSDAWYNTEGALYTSQTIARTTTGYAEQVAFDIPAGTTELALFCNDADDGYSYDHGDFINPRYVLDDGSELAVNAAKDTLYTIVSHAWDNTAVHINKNINGATLKVAGTSYTTGIACHANSVILLQLPALTNGRRIVGFKALCGIDDSGSMQAGSTSSVKFYFFPFDPTHRDYGDAAIAKARSGFVSRTHNFSGVDLTADLTGQSKLQLVVTNGGDQYAYDRADWVNPVLVDSEGNETSLTSLTPDSYTSDWSTLHKNTSVENTKLNIGGTQYATGLGMNGRALAVYTLPADKHYVTFKAKVGLDYSVLKDAPSAKTNATVEFLVFGNERLIPTTSTFTLPLAKLGIEADRLCRVTDLWSKKNLGTFSGNAFSTTLSRHESALYRITPLDRTNGNSVTISSRDVRSDSAYIDITVSGPTDSTTYVQILCDGQPVGCIAVAGSQTVTYLATPLNGKHQFQALCSGSMTTAACTSNVLEVEPVKTSISQPSTNGAKKHKAKKGIYSLSGQQIVSNASGTATASNVDTLPRGIYIVNQKKMVCGQCK